MRRLVSIFLAASLIVGMWVSPSQASEGLGERRKLFREGSKLWPVYCAQCHNARPGSEFAPYQWNVILMHMRTQANLPAQNARAILEYLKAGR